MWWKEAVIYEVSVDKFAVNFPGLADKLDYLKDLGVNCLHILPHYPSPMVDDGYDVSDYKGVRPELGTLDDFKKFTEHAHALGIKIIVDLVLNHASTMHPLFIEASNKESDAKKIFLWSKTGTEFLDVIDFWVGMGADGFRIDAASHIAKKEGTNCKGLPEAHEILMKLRARVDKNYLGVILLAEVHDSIIKMKEYFNKGAE